MPSCVDLCAPSHARCSSVLYVWNLSFYVTLHPPVLLCYVTLADTLMLMCCTVVLIYPERQIISASYLRGFSASESSFLTVPLNLISANPDVLERNKKQGSTDNKTTRQEFHTDKVKFEFRVCTDAHLDNMCTERKTVLLMNALIASLIGCS